MYESLNAVRRPDTQPGNLSGILSSTALPTASTSTVHTRLRGMLVALLLGLVALSITAPVFAEAEAVDAGQVNINDAEQDELTLLPRVGPALATRIIAFREENGAFESTEDLILVRGIGEKTYALMAPYLTLEGKTTLREKVRIRPSAE